MSGGVFGGDEVGSIVLDPGSHSFRVGYGGEETPKFDIPSFVGVREANSCESEYLDGIHKKEYFAGTLDVNYPRADTEILSFIKEGMVDDWDAFESVLDYVYKKCLMTESKDHSVLFTESPWNKKDKREKLAEIVFEKLGVPAFYLVKNAVLAAFANGRVSGLVIDSGATHTSATPVYDGYCLKNAVVHFPIGGDFIVDHCSKMLEKEKIEVVPHYKISSKREVKDGEPSLWEKKKKSPKSN